MKTTPFSPFQSRLQIKSRDGRSSFFLRVPPPLSSRMYKDLRIHPFLQIRIHILLIHVLHSTPPPTRLRKRNICLLSFSYPLLAGPTFFSSMARPPSLNTPLFCPAPIRARGSIFGSAFFFLLLDSSSLLFSSHPQRDVHDVLPFPPPPRNFSPEREG